MKSIVAILITAVLVIAAVVLVSSAYVVEEGRQVIVTQFGDPRGDAVVDAGLHFKLPFIQEIHHSSDRTPKPRSFESGSMTSVVNRSSCPTIPSAGLRHSARPASGRGLCGWIRSRPPDFVFVTSDTAQASSEGREGQIHEAEKTRFWPI